MTVSFFLFLIVSFYLVDFYESVLVPSHKLGSVQVRGNLGFLYFSAKVSLRRKLTELLLVIVYCCYTMGFDRAYCFHALFLGVYACSASYLAYTPKFSFFKYLFFGLFVVSRYMILGLSLFILYLLYFGWRLYAPSFSLYRIQNKRRVEGFRSFLYGSLIVSFGILFFKDFIRVYPLEQFFLFFIMIVTSQLESKYKDHKLYLKICQNRYILSLIRLKQPRLDFLSTRQKRDYFTTLFLVSILFVPLLIVGSYRIDLIILYAGVWAQLLFSFDVITQHHLLKRSIVYGNPVTLFLVDSLVSAFVFMQLFYYTVLKLLASRVDFWIVSLVFRCVGSVVFLCLISFFFLRLKKDKVGIDS